MWFGKGLTLSKTINFRPFQSDEFADNKFEFDENSRNFSQTGRKHCGKRRNWFLLAISPIPTVFPKD